MAQTGFHGLAGLAAARLIVPRAPAEAAVPLTLAVTIGAILPDLDLYPASIAWLAGREHLAEGIHRSLTHSLVLMAALAAAGLALRSARLAAGWTGTAGWVLLGLPLGMLTHAALDILLWFTALDLFWPVSHLPAGAQTWWWPLGTMPEGRALLPVLDIWNLDSGHPGPGIHLPAVFGNPEFIVNALGAMETLAFALFFVDVRRIAGSERVKRHTPGLRRWTAAAWVIGFLLLLAAFPMPNNRHIILAESALLLAFFPYGIALAWRQRESLAAWARGQETGRAVRR